MAAGDKITLNYQYEFRDLLFGSATDYVVEEVEGLLGLPGVVTNDQKRQDDHGDHRGLDLLEGRKLLFKINIKGVPGTDIESKIRAAVSAFQVSKRAGTQEFRMVTQRPGRGKLFIDCRARRMAFPSNYDTAKGIAKGAAELAASDPRFYSIVESSTVIQIADLASQAQANVNMNGDFTDGSEPVIEIVGPATNPRLTNQSDGNRSIRIDVALTAADTMVVDVKNKTVLINGIDRYDTVRTDNQWWNLIPGVNTILYSRATTAGISRATVRHNDAYISV